MSNRKDESTFMAAHGNRTSDQSRALEKMIYRMQKANYDKSLGLLTDEQRLANYEKSLGLLTDEQRRANSLLGYKKGLALLTVEERRANSSLAYEKGLALLTVVDGMHDLAIHGIVVQAKHGIGIVKSVQKLCISTRQRDGQRTYGAQAHVIFKDKQVGTKRVYINSLRCNGQRCQFGEEYAGSWFNWPETKEDAINRGFQWGKCSKCHKAGSCKDPNNLKRKHRHRTKLCANIFRP